MGTLTTLVKNYDDVIKTGVEIYDKYSIPNAAIESVENYLRGADLNEELAGLVAGYGVGEVAGAIVAGSLLSIGALPSVAAVMGLGAGILLGDLASDLAKKVYREWDDFSLDEYEKSLNDWWKDFEARNNPGGVILPGCYSNNCINPNPNANTNYLGSRSFAPRRDPLALDLDGDGLETTAIGTNPTLFDHDADGVRTGTGWLKGDDAFLALDRNGNGLIDSGRELFGVDTVLANGQTAANGFAALADLDSNHDGQFSNLDSQYANVNIWRDLDQDGVSDAGELTSLADAGIASINLTSTATNVALAGGNVQTAAGTYTKTNGQTGTVGDFTTGGTGNLDLAQNPFYSDFTDTITLTDAARAVPNMQGSGMVRDLQEAASLDGALVSDVNGLSGLTRPQMMSALDTLIAHWADTSTMPTSVEQAEDKGYTLRYLLPGMSASDILSVLGMDGGSGGGIQSDKRRHFDGDTFSNCFSIEDLLEPCCPWIEYRVHQAASLVPLFGCASRASCLLLAFTFGLPGIRFPPFHGLPVSASNLSL